MNFFEFEQMIFQIFQINFKDRNFLIRILFSFFFNVRKRLIDDSLNRQLNSIKNFRNCQK